MQTAQAKRLEHTFLSTPSARRATPRLHRGTADTGDFYPRPPRGGRQRLPDGLSQPFHISIHALREEGDPYSSSPLLILLHFYPRPPRGGRRLHGHSYQSEQRFLSTPSARRATWPYCPCRSCPKWISIHALREEGDYRPPAAFRSPTIFLSTPSARRATSASVKGRSMSKDFYPRPPRGGRLQFHHC